MIETCQPIGIVLPPASDIDKLRAENERLRAALATSESREKLLREAVEYARDYSWASGDHGLAANMAEALKEVS